MTIYAYVAAELAGLFMRTLIYEPRVTGMSIGFFQIDRSSNLSTYCQHALNDTKEDSDDVENKDWSLAICGVREKEERDNDRNEERSQDSACE